MTIAVRINTSLDRFRLFEQKFKQLRLQNQWSAFRPWTQFLWAQTELRYACSLSGLFNKPSRTTKGVQICAPFVLALGHGSSEAEELVSRTDRGGRLVRKTIGGRHSFSEHFVNAYPPKRNARRY
jgi:hypothetical protein